MSNTKKQKSKYGLADDGETATFLLVRSSSGLKDEVTMSMKDSLRSLKTTISESEDLGCIPEEYQRIIHLGRELKTNGRSLERLGVGKYGVYVIHVHSTQPATSNEAYGIDSGKRHSTRGTDSEADQQAKQQESVIDLDDSDDEDIVVVGDTTHSAAKRRRVT